MRIRKKRPTLKDAHDFIKQGHHTVNAWDYVSSEERIREAEKIEAELRLIASSGIPRTRNLEYMILKCHLIAEFVLTRYIIFYSEPVISADAIRFSYSQKLDIAYFMGFGVTDPLLIPSLELLNKARNQVVHTFRLDQSIINEFIRINSEDPDKFVTPSLTIQLQSLRNFTRYLCYFTAGIIDARSYYSLQIDK
jgi:hypothetical protein